MLILLLLLLFFCWFWMCYSFALFWFLSRFAVDSVDGDCYDSFWCRRSAELCTINEWIDVHRHTDSHTYIHTLAYVLILASHVMIHWGFFLLFTCISQQYDGWNAIWLCILFGSAHEETTSHSHVRRRNYAPHLLRNKKSYKSTRFIIILHAYDMKAYCSPDSSVEGCFRMCWMCVRVRGICMCMWLAFYLCP